MSFVTLTVTALLSASLQTPTLDPAALERTARPDSARVLRQARRAQDEFERLRRWNAPRTFDRAPAPCQDQIIGRFCYWYGDTAESRPPVEPPAIVKGRQRLLGTLSAARSAIAGDEWIAGQRTRYLIEAGDTSAAVDEARVCRSTRWWCEALLGFALHAARDYAAADIAFGRALAAMTERERCRWTDLAPLLDDGARKRYRTIPCDARQEENARIWWLADPFHGVPGNDRRTEHYARLTMARMQEHAWNAHNIPWGDDLTEGTVRYGWSTWYTRGVAPLHASFDIPITGRGRVPAYRFVPDEDVLAALTDAVEPWPIAGVFANGRMAREYYAPAYAITVGTIAADAQLFRRGDSVAVVVGYDATSVAQLHEQRMDLAVVLAPSATATPVVVEARGARLRGVLLARAPWHGMLMSVELLSSSAERAARARQWIGSVDPARPQEISGLLLLEPSAGSPTSLEDALPHARPGPLVDAGTRVGLYWEHYDIAPSDTLLVALSVRREGAGRLRRLAERAKLARKWTPIGMSWREAGRERARILARTVVLDLSELDPGRYHVELRVTRVGSQAMVAERRLEIVAPGR